MEDLFYRTAFRDRYHGILRVGGPAKKEASRTPRFLLPSLPDARAGEAGLWLPNVNMDS